MSRENVRAVGAEPRAVKVMVPLDCCCCGRKKRRENVRAVGAGPRPFR